MFGRRRLLAHEIHAVGGDLHESVGRDERREDRDEHEHADEAEAEQQGRPLQSAGQADQLGAGQLSPGSRRLP
ncbi:hypothetical protein [Nocardia crassostreae]|uniref:hypothetical protein n=1 Tax=Nocardia crassostreae TaxID=53428 RepID=UPI001FE2350B|nr:hypothetical protein [Nocardia crassostreae]